MPTQTRMLRLSQISHSSRLTESRITMIRSTARVVGPPSTGCARQRPAIRPPGPDGGGRASEGGSSRVGGVTSSTGI